MLVDGQNYVTALSTKHVAIRMLDQFRKQMNTTAEKDRKNHTKHPCLFWCATGDR
jgi:hypothetical protein